MSASLLQCGYPKLYWGRGGKARVEGAEGRDLGLVRFLVYNSQGSCYCHLPETSFTRGNVFPSVTF